MDHVQLTDAMQARILKNAEIARKKNKRRKQKIASLALVASIALLFFASGSYDLFTRPPVTVVNPIEEVATLDEAEEILGFNVSLPANETIKSIVVYDGVMLEVTYEDYSLRVQVSDEDISGDNNNYVRQEVVDVNGIDVTLKGNGEAYFLASWKEQTFMHALSYPDGSSRDDILALIKRFIE